jgi:pimeloyl-ACP methyl ester carboxylesterase
MNPPGNFEIALDADRSLSGILDLPSLPGPRPTVLICHGFKGFMEWGFFPYLAALLAERGFVAVRFNFSGSGMQAGDELVTDTEAFGTATHSKDLAELGYMIDALGVEIAPERIDRERIGLLGHSRGGGTSILATGHAATKNSVRSLVTWSAVSTFDRLTEEQKVKWRKSGSLPITNARTGQEIGLDRVVLDDLDRSSDRLDIVAAATRCRIPWLIVHGQSDETVPVDEARVLADKAPETARLETIAKGSHTFGATHPLDGPTPQLITALNLTQHWFRTTLCD